MYCVPNPDGRGGYKVDLVVLAAVEWVQVYSDGTRCLSSEILRLCDDCGFCEPSRCGARYVKRRSFSISFEL